MIDYTLAQKEKIQDRLSHFLRRYRTLGGFTQKETASKLSYSTSRYKVFESEYIDNPIINAISVLKKFGSLERMEVGEFAEYLINRRRSSFKKEFKLSEDSLRQLKSLKPQIRASFQRFVSETKIAKLEEILSILPLLLKLNEGQLDALKKFIQSMTDDS